MNAPAGAAVRGRVEWPEFSLEAQLSVRPGELVTVVGPNGSGKTTLLRVLAGLTPLTSGSATIGDVVVDQPAIRAWIPPEKRSIGFVFHDHRLFDGFDVLDNVAFGLRARGSRRSPARTTARHCLEHLDAAHLADRSPRELSTGESQRVALARALVPDPAVLLLDEPFSALDDPSRRWIRRALTGETPDGSSRPTRLVVTHDPAEALTLGSRVVVLEAGRIVQDGTPDEIARHPLSPYAAALVGMNVLRGHARQGTVTLADGVELRTASRLSGPVTAIVSPRAVGLFEKRPEGTPRNMFEMVVDGFDREENRVRVRLRGPVPLVAEVTPAAVDDLGISPGRALWAAVKATEIDLRPR